ncbi:hypothetical protein L2E82_40727 [Cichorium intybus]|uniref:Uncharacterized protein n=1 Tax=Cichorium intybus TaxID=13427 RepID=A0ACB9ALT9_CICIN|nr:hypothetical protein L2E82_40727 [Cichorium intybus]
MENFFLIFKEFNRKFYRELVLNSKKGNLIIELFYWVKLMIVLCRATPWKKAPELLLGAKEYSTTIDMWSLGCIMVELLPKQLLFNGKTEFDQLDKATQHAQDRRARRVMKSPHPLEEQRRKELQQAKFGTGTLCPSTLILRNTLCRFIVFFTSFSAFLHTPLETPMQTTLPVQTPLPGIAPTPLPWTMDNYNIPTNYPSFILFTATTISLVEPKAPS